MSEFKDPLVQRQASYNSLYVNPLSDLKHNRCCSEGNHASFSDNKESIVFGVDKENAAPSTQNGSSSPVAKQTTHLKSLSTIGTFDTSKHVPRYKSLSTGKVLKESSLQFCMQMNEPDKAFGCKLWDPIDSEHSASLNIWDYSDSEAAPASSWSTLPNRALLCRPLPLDIGRCTCVIVKEPSPDGFHGGTLYSLYTSEGKGRQDRKLAVAYHKRRKGKSIFAIAQTTKGILSNTDDSCVGLMTANLFGSKYHIWNQGGRTKPSNKQSNPLLGVVRFMPTIATWTGSYRRMKAYIPKHQSMQLKNVSQMQHINGLPKDWEGKMDKIHKLFTRIPRYNNMLNQYELDFRERGRAAGLRIQSSVKNFQLTLEENGRQTILQLGRADRYKYVMDFRYPLTGYQAFCISLASIDSKLCCAM
ncbi:LOW QUALITY PROTEIN: tubby-like protein 8 [Hibiscus syriacus]|uniref:LOW QUALITY PROTEIN: tubby-like protein 8 n=1 Tax=Hibiscus syriacus TaxID=106335 RepID=UPI001923BB8E|nr:LOW QUALITY PROTEIN: tubby-like protein 8 [Hibiscus syriacus]